jgi:thiamine transporter ThiT
MLVIQIHPFFVSNNALKGPTAHVILFTPHVLSGICWFGEVAFALHGEAPLPFIVE